MTITPVTFFDGRYAVVVEGPPAVIDHLIERAKAAGVRFDQRARKPIVVEFAGVPKAGKTSTIGQVVAFFKRCGFRVEVVVERASVCPIRDLIARTGRAWILAKIGRVARLTSYQLMIGPNWTGSC